MRRYVILALALGGCFSGPPYDGAASDHFDGRRFRNEVPGERGPLDVVEWQLRGRERGPWPEWTDAAPGAPPPARVDGGRLRVTFVNHATALVQMDGVNILTDPVWSDGVGPLPFGQVPRRRPPGIRFEDLPPIDAVVVSHDHYDHLDLPTLERLAAVHHPRIFVGLGNRALLERNGVAGGVDLDWWERSDLTERVRITAVPARHASMRALGDRDETLWCGWVISGPSGSVYFAGDTGFGPHFEEIRARCGAPRLALLPIGAYKPRWFMEPMHMSPDDAVRAHVALGAATSLGVHFGTFALGDESELDPVADLARALAREAEVQGAICP
ncbi:MAG TPA: MBL fold metallo-hydrolase, partial [Planctomycetota bacterium]|nr:MBL fold metallo-hydrolase [Planctomycetota bacterium]